MNKPTKERIEKLELLDSYSQGIPEPEFIRFNVLADKLNQLIDAYNSQSRTRGKGR